MKLTFEFGEFSKEVQDATTRPQRVRRLVMTRLRIVSFNAERYIKIRMPVDQGTARASWGHSTAPAGVDDGIWIENEDDLSITQGSKLPYIERLNEGWSTQAPAGFIDAEVQRAIDDFAKGIEDDIAKEIAG